MLNPILSTPTGYVRTRAFGGKVNYESLNNTPKVGAAVPAKSEWKRVFAAKLENGEFLSSVSLFCWSPFVDTGGVTLTTLAVTVEVVNPATGLSIYDATEIVSTSTNFLMDAANKFYQIPITNGGIVIPDNCVVYISFHDGANTPLPTFKSGTMGAEIWTQKVGVNKIN
jgi:hypothetical protein